jgi:hypothetical protein
LLSSSKRRGALRFRVRRERGVFSTEDWRNYENFIRFIKGIHKFPESSRKPHLAQILNRPPQFRTPPWLQI